MMRCQPIRYGSKNVASATPVLCGNWSISGKKVTFTGPDGFNATYNVARWPTKTPTTGRKYFEIEVYHSILQSLTLFVGVVSPDLVGLCGSWSNNYHASARFSSLISTSRVSAYSSSITDTFTNRTLFTRVGVAMDFDTNSIWISVNGTWLYTDISDANGLFSNNRWGLNDYAPFIARQSSTGLLTAELFEDDADFVYKPPGFAAWGLV